MRGATLRRDLPLSFHHRLPSRGVALRALVLAASSCASLSSLAAARYAVRDVTPPGAGVCEARAINASGQVAGGAFADTSYASGRGFLTGVNGVGLRAMDLLPGGAVATLTGIADDGTATGWSQTTASGDTQHAVLLHTGSSRPIDLGTLEGGDLSSSNGMGAHGRVVGSSNQGDGTWAGWFLRRGATLEVVPMGTGTLPVSAGPDGSIVGTMCTPDFTRCDAFLTDPSGATPVALASLGGFYATAEAANRHREVVGYSSGLDGLPHAFVTDAGGANLRDLGLPGVQSIAQGINAHGRIVGNATADWGQPSRAFISDRDGHWSWLDAQAGLPAGGLVYAAGINDAGQIAAKSSDGRCLLLTPR